MTADDAARAAQAARPIEAGRGEVAGQVVLTVGRHAAQARGAGPARQVAQHHVVTRPYLLDASPHALDHPGALVAQHDRERHLPRPHRQVGVADPGPHQAHCYLILSRLLQQQNPAGRGPRDPGGQVAVRGKAADDVAAAVQIQHGPVVARAGSRHPLGRPASHLGRHDRHIPGHRPDAGDALVSRTLLGDRRRRPARQRLLLGPHRIHHQVVLNARHGPHGSPDRPDRRRSCPA